jgi:hypothetical protein
MPPTDPISAVIAIFVGDGTASHPNTGSLTGTGYQGAPGQPGGNGTRRSVGAGTASQRRRCRSALERLAREGLIERGRGRRSRATFTPGCDLPAPSFNMIPEPDVPSIRHKLINHGVDIAPAEACRVFGLDPGSQLWQALRVTLVGRKAQSSPTMCSRSNVVWHRQDREALDLFDPR